MRPKKLTMQAFGSYGKATIIDFTRPNQNIFLIAGNTGAGKTTIFDAIVFALYGESSSEANRKDGVELQSQFGGYEAEPFVELVFSGMEGGEERLYTLRRIPRHLRLLTKGKNKGALREGQEVVSLLLPDGSEFSGNRAETNRKVEEIVGLTKKQFMQVGMIAQGEFMKLLRAKSDEKKAIFRKLFHTELFQQVVDELLRRKNDMKSRIEQVHLICKKDVGRAKIPEGAEEAAELSRLQKSILTPGKLDITDLEAFLEGLGRLCGRLAEEREAAGRLHEELSRQRDAEGAAWAAAQQVLKSFGELRKAEKELAECSKAEEEMLGAQRLLGKILDSYEIQSRHQRYEEAQKNCREMEKALAEQREKLPGWKKKEAAAASEEEGARALQEREAEVFTQTEDRVKKSLETLEELRKAEGEAKRRRADRLKAEASMDAAKKELEEFEAKEQETRRQAERLGDVDVRSARLEGWQKEADGIAGDIRLAERAQEELKQQRQEAARQKEAYGIAKQNYQKQHELYLEKQTAFLDAQAGFLAREKLRPGKPCPVCGSLEHPLPCSLSQEHRELTREVIEELAAKDEARNREQNEKSERAGRAVTLCEEKERSFRELGEQLRSRMEKSMGELPEKMTLKEAADRLALWQEELHRQRDELRKKSMELEGARAFLKDAEKNRQSLKEKWEKSSTRVTEAQSALSAARAKAEHLAEQRDYPTEEAARSALAEARSRKEKADGLCQAARRAAQEARSGREKTEALIARYETELPKLGQEAEERKALYEALCEEKELAESEWQEIVFHHRKEEAEEIRSRLEAYSRKKAVAEGAGAAARKAIGNQPKPDLEKLEAGRKETEEKLRKAKEQLEALGELCRINADVYQALAPQMEDRSQMLGKFSRLDGLHSRFAGKVHGARMDIETFVQRYYLEQILQAANVRFRRMSAGQFELRMTAEEQAGEGRNHGLDLMVYSAVTGKEREVRTLSGGESFMAALSLALGMADQIQESSAAIRLDVMFIDEGFGSLDDHSRSQAVKVLQQVADGSRLIGIISHVTELKQEIENQLLVSKDEEGSHVKWQIS